MTEARITDFCAMKCFAPQDPGTPKGTEPKASGVPFEPLETSKLDTEKGEPELQIILVSGEGEGQVLLANAFKVRLKTAACVIERRPNILRVIRTKFRYFNPLKVVLQVPIIVLNRFAEFGWRWSFTFQRGFIYYTSISSAPFREFLKSCTPTLVITIGIGKISEELILAFGCPIVNFHSGLLPYDRGLHGAYWARRGNSERMRGYTYHLITKELDRGQVLLQRMLPTQGSTLFTDYLEISEFASKHVTDDLEVLLARLGTATNSDQMIEAGKIAPIQTEPSIFDYLYSGIVKGVW